MKRKIVISFEIRKILNFDKNFLTENILQQEKTLEFFSSFNIHLEAFDLKKIVSKILYFWSLRKRGLSERGVNDGKKEH